jgi:hypothetical protein
MLESAEVQADLQRVRDEQGRLLATNQLPGDILLHAGQLRLPLPPGHLADWQLGGLGARLHSSPAVRRTASAR